MDDNELRVRLEGRAELLQATVLRYRALVGALKAFRWKERLRRVVDVLQTVAREQDAVDSALAFVRRKAALEAWPKGPVLASAAETDALLVELRRQVARRLGDDASRVLAEDLFRLERLATASPRLVLPGHRWQVACTALPPSLPELEVALRFGSSLERVFGRPMDPRGALKVTPPEWALVERSWVDGVRALEVVWKRAEAIDLSGGVGRMLRRRAKRLPRVELSQGPTMLVYAEFWRALARSRMEQLSSVRVEPATLRPEEHFAVFAWLVRRQSDPTAPLDLPPPRAALLELAHLLSGSARASPRERPWDALDALAGRADDDREDPDWRRVHDALYLLARVAATPAKWLPPVYREGAPARSTLDKDASLRELVDSLRAHLLSAQ